MNYIQSQKKLYDFTGDMSKHFPKLKKSEWVINDVEYEITDQCDNDLRQEKTDELNIIKDALESSTVFDVIQNYSHILTGRNGPWICKKLNIKLNGEAYKPKKIKSFDLPNNATIIHNQEYRITDYDGVYFINLDVLKLSKVLELTEEFKKTQIQFILMTKKYDLIDLFKYFNVIRSTYTEKGYMILI